MGCCFGAQKVGFVADSKQPVQIKSQRREKTKSIGKPRGVERAFEQQQSAQTTEEWLNLIERLNSNQSLLAYARARSRANFRRVSELADYLSKCNDARTQVEKAWLVFVWITDNIAYDVDSYRRRSNDKCDSQSVLERGMAVCAGYANLFKDLCDLLKIECVKISGLSKVLGKSNGTESHAWNAIVYGNSYRYVDVTWASGPLTKDSR